MDLPHKILDIETKTNGAYTVAIKIPSSGAGIDYIDNEACENFLPYTESNIILHSGSDFHRIASIKKYIPKDICRAPAGALQISAGALQISFCVL